MSKVRVDRDGALAQIVLDTPPLNLFDAELITDLAAAVRRGRRRPPARGAGSSRGPRLHRRRRCRRLSRPVGRTIAGGVRGARLDRPRSRGHAGPDDRRGRRAVPDCRLRALAGLRPDLAGESARFGLVEIVVGLTPAMGGTQRVAERAGPARARELVMTGELFDAATLERWNVVNRVVPGRRARRGRSGACEPACKRADPRQRRD